MIKRLSYYAKQADELLFHQFAVRFDEHVLVLVPPASEPAPDPLLSTEFDHNDPMIRPFISDEYRVTPLRKKEGAHPFEMFLTVGRAANNDIVLKDIQVSKVHAFFEVDPQGNWTIRDSNSTNGTFIGGQQITSTEKSLIRSADTVKFGPGLSAVFFNPADFYQFLRSREVREAFFG